MPPTSPQDGGRLADLMDERRLQLGLDWRDVAERAGLSYEAVRLVRSGSQARKATYRRIDRALSWEPGSIEHIREGGLPQPALPEDLAERQRLALWFSEEMLQRGRSMADVRVFVRRMGWDAAFGAPFGAPNDIAVWRAVGSELGISTLEAMKAAHVITDADLPPESPGDRRRRPPAEGRDQARS